MMDQTIVELSRNDMKFSVAHFTIFSETHRERIHGHNYYLKLRYKASVGDLGLSFDYRPLRKFLLEKCKFLNESFLIPQESPHLVVDKSHGEHSLRLVFNKKEMILLKEDVTLLSLKNISSESLASWFLNSLLEETSLVEDNGISFLEIVISTTQGHESSVFWER